MRVLDPMRHQSKPSVKPALNSALTQQKSNLPTPEEKETSREIRETMGGRRMVIERTRKKVGAEQIVKVNNGRGFNDFDWGQQMKFHSEMSSHVDAEGETSPLRKLKENYLGEGTYFVSNIVSFFLFFCYC